MNRMKNIGLILCGLVLGLTLSSPAARAVGSLKVTLSTNRILVDGKEVRLTAYNINGNNYVMLRDVGKTVGFEVYWDGDTKCVQIESDKPYTGEAPVKAGTSEPASQPEVTTPADEVAVAKQDIAALSICFSARWRKSSRTMLPLSSIRFLSRRRVLYALKDFLIKRFGSLLEHTT